MLVLILTTMFAFTPTDNLITYDDSASLIQRVKPIGFDHVRLNPARDRADGSYIYEVRPELTPVPVREEAINLLNESETSIDLGETSEKPYRTKFTGSWDNPNTALVVNLNTSYSGALLDSATDQDWFAVVSPNAGKITFQLSTVSSTVDYRLDVWRLNGSTLVEQTTSTLPAGAIDQVSVVTQANGVYYFRVMPVSGFGSQYVFLAAHTTGFDTSEPDDSLSQANGLSSSGNWSANLESDLDVDVYQYSFTSTETPLGIAIDAETGMNVGYQLFNASWQPVTPFQTVSGVWNMPSGNWFIRISMASPSTNPVNQRDYTLKTWFPSTAQLASYSLSDWVPFPDVPDFYAVDNQCMELEAEIIDMFGAPVPDLTLHYEVMRDHDSPLNATHDWQFREGNVTTDSNGKVHKYIRLYPTFAGSGYQVDAFYLNIGSGFSIDGLLVSNVFAHYWAAAGPCN